MQRVERQGSGFVNGIGRAAKGTVQRNAKLGGTYGRYARYPLRAFGNRKAMAGWRRRIAVSLTRRSVAEKLRFGWRTPLGRESKQKDKGKALVFCPVFWIAVRWRAAH